MRSALLDEANAFSDLWNLSFAPILILEQH